MTGLAEDFYHRCERRFRAALDALDPAARAAMARYRMAPFASDPEVSLTRGPLYVASMKPYALPGREYPFGWDERVERPGLHRWLDGPPGGGNFRREAVALVRFVLDVLGSRSTVREVFNTYATFFRAENAAQLKGWGLDRIDCSAFHRELLGIVRPRVVLCIGNGAAPSAFALLQAIAAPRHTQRREVATRTYVKWFREPLPGGGSPSLVLGVPHLSYTRAALLEAGVGLQVRQYLERFGER